MFSKLIILVLKQTCARHLWIFINSNPAPSHKKNFFRQITSHSSVHFLANNVIVSWPPVNPANGSKLSYFPAQSVRFWQAAFINFQTAEETWFIFPTDWLTMNRSLQFGAKCRPLVALTIGGGTFALALFRGQDREVILAQPRTIRGKCNLTLINIAPPDTQKRRLPALTIGGASGERLTIAYLPGGSQF